MSNSSGFYIRRAKDGQFYFYLRATNGQILFTSEMYTSKQAARDGIASVKANAGASVYDVSDQG